MQNVYLGGTGEWKRQGHVALAATSKPGHREAEEEAMYKDCLGETEKAQQWHWQDQQFPLQLTALSPKAHHLCRFIEDSVKNVSKCS